MNESENNTPKPQTQKDTTMARNPIDNPLPDRERSTKVCPRCDGTKIDPKPFTAFPGETNHVCRTCHGLGRVSKYAPPAIEKEGD